MPYPLIETMINELPSDVRAQVVRIRTAGQALLEAIEAVYEPTSIGGITLPRAQIVGRKLELARARAEEAIMWATNAATDGA